MPRGALSTPVPALDGCCSEADVAHVLGRHMLDMRAAVDALFADVQRDPSLAEDEDWGARMRYAERSRTAAVEACVLHGVGGAGL